MEYLDIPDATKPQNCFLWTSKDKKDKCQQKSRIAAEAIDVLTHSASEGLSMAAEIPDVWNICRSECILAYFVWHHAYM